MRFAPCPAALIALVSVATASKTCTFPPSSAVSAGARATAALNLSFTCMPGTQDVTTRTTSTTIDGPIPSNMYVDAKATLYDMSPVASFIDGSRVKAAIIKRSASPDALTTMLTSAKEEGAEIALLTEEDFGASRDNGPGEGLTGAHVSAVAAAAKKLSIYVICPFRMQLSAGESFNGAVVIGKNGTILRAANSGIDHYEKVFPVLGWPIGSLSVSFPGGAKPAFSVQKGEVPVIPGQHGVQVWDLPGIGRIAILICCRLQTLQLVVFLSPPAQHLPVCLCIDRLTDCKLLVFLPLLRVLSPHYIAACVQSISTTMSCGIRPTLSVRRLYSGHR